MREKLELRVNSSQLKLEAWTELQYDHSRKSKSEGGYLRAIQISVEVLQKSECSHIFP